MGRLLALTISSALALSFLVPAAPASSNDSTYQKTLSVFRNGSTSLTNEQKGQVKAAVEANPNAEKLICTGIRFESSPLSENVTVRKRAKAACDFAKQLSPNLSTSLQNKPTKVRSYAGKVLLILEPSSSEQPVGSAVNVSNLPPPAQNPQFRKVSNPKTGLSAKSWPAVRPQLNSTGCTLAAIELKYSSGKRFIANGGISYSVASPSGKFGNQVKSEIDSVDAYTRSKPLQKIGPLVVPIEVEICSENVPKGDEKFARVKLSLQRTSGSTFDGLEIRVDFINTNMALLQDELTQKCLQNQNYVNFPVAQTEVAPVTRDPYTARITGTRAKIEGTVFVNSVALKGVEVRFYQEYENSSGALQWPGEPIGKTITDNLGQFETSLPIKRLALSGGETMVTAFVSKSVQPLGQGALVVSGASFKLYFDWLVIPGHYTGNKFDLPPTVSSDCERAYFSYLDASLGDGEDENKRLARYLVLHEANRWFNGYKDSQRKYMRVQCRDESWGAACNYFESGIPAPKASQFGSLGQKCWHRQGHTRKLKNGTVSYVNSHQACRS